MALLPPYSAFNVSGTISPAANFQLGLLTGFSAAAVTRWLQLFEVPAPALGATPRQSFPVPPGGTFSFAPSALSPAFGAVCFWAVSDTGPTFTQSADSFFVYAEGQGA